MARDRTEGGTAGGTPVLEWVAAGVGLALTAALLGHLLWQAFDRRGDPAPDLALRVDRVTPVDGAWVVEVTAENRSSTPADAVEVEGVLRRDGREVDRGRATLGLVAGHSEQRGGLVLGSDPADGELDLRALGFAEP